MIWEIIIHEELKSYWWICRIKRAMHSNPYNNYSLIVTFFAPRLSSNPSSLSATAHHLVAGSVVERLNDWWNTSTSRWSFDMTASKAQHWKLPRSFLSRLNILRFQKHVIVTQYNHSSIIYSKHEICNSMWWKSFLVLSGRVDTVERKKYVYMFLLIDVMSFSLLCA